MRPEVVGSGAGRIRNQRERARRGAETTPCVRSERQAPVKSVGPSVAILLEPEEDPIPQVVLRWGWSQDPSITTKGKASEE